MLKKLKKAFTITELVIVIAVIAILAAVLIPTFANVIENANQSAALQTCTNALHDYQPIALTDDDPNNDDMTGVVFVSDDYAYAYINSSLQYVGKLEDLYYISSGGDVDGGEKPADTNLTITDTVNADIATVTFTYAEPEVTENVVQKFTVSTLAQGGADVEKKTAENLYFYTIKSNNTTYFGYFTMEMGDGPAYQTQGASYSRSYGYFNLENGSLNVVTAAA